MSDDHKFYQEEKLHNIAFLSFSFIIFQNNANEEKSFPLENFFSP